MFVSQAFLPPNYQYLYSLMISLFFLLCSIQTEMTYSLLSSLRPKDRLTTICVRVVRTWEFRGINDDGALQHIDLILADTQVCAYPTNFTKHHALFSTLFLFLWLLYITFPPRETPWTLKYQLLKPLAMTRSSKLVIPTSWTDSECATIANVATRYLPTVVSVGRELIIILLLLLTTKAAYSSSEISRPLLKYVISRKLYTFYGRARDSARHLLVRGGKGH